MNSKGDLISREALKEAFKGWKGMDDYYHNTDCVDIPFSEAYDLIDNAPTVKAYTEEELKKKYDEGLNDGYATCYDRYVRKNDEPFC